jgi:hypothetical protein
MTDKNNKETTEIQELEKQIETELGQDKYKDIVDFILDEEFSAKEQTGKLRNEFFSDKLTRLYTLPKLKQLENTLITFSESLRKNDIDIEKLSYAIRSHEKQILVLERFIEQQNIKNEQIHLEIANLKIALDSIQKQLSSAINFIEQQAVKNDQVHSDITTLRGNVDIIQQQTSSILLSIDRIGGNFERHIDEMDAMFLRKAKKESEKSEKDIEHYKLLVKIGYWIAGTLGAISFIALSVYSVVTEQTFPALLIHIFKMLPWN